VVEPLEIFLPSLLLHADVAELAAAVGGVHFVRPRRANGKPGEAGTEAAAAAWMWERLGI
jgi:hypothetical protein